MVPATNRDESKAPQRPFQFQGCDIHWTRIGHGPPVVLCHGTPWSSYVWRHVGEELRKKHTVYVWDMLGYGQSEKPDDDVSIATQGRLLASLLVHWGLESPDVIAHDIGGAVALRAHLLHGTKMRSLALIDVVALRPWGSPFYRLVANNEDVFAALPENLHAALVREYISGASARGLAPDVLDKLVAPWRGYDQAAFYRQIAQGDERHTAELEPLFSDMRLPTHIVWGEADQWVPLDRATDLAELIPGATMEIIAGAGHLVQEDNPAELAAALTRWLDRPAVPQSSTVREWLERLRRFAPSL